MAPKEKRRTQKAPNKQMLEENKRPRAGTSRGEILLDGPPVGIVADRTNLDCTQSQEEEEEETKREAAMPKERKGETMLIGSFAIRTRVEPKKQASLKLVQAKSNDHTEKERTVKGIAVRKSDERS